MDARRGRRSHPYAVAIVVAAVMLSLAPAHIPVPAAASIDLGEIRHVVGGVGDRGLATDAPLVPHHHEPGGVDVAADGDVYLVERSRARLRRIEATTGEITTVGGTGLEGYGGDGGPATQGLLSRPVDVAVEAGGTVLVVDSGNRRIRRYDPASGVITTVAGDGRTAPTSIASGTPATGVGVEASRVAAGPDGSFALIQGQQVLEVDPSGLIHVRAGRFATRGTSGDGGPAVDALLDGPRDLVVDPAGDIFVAEAMRIRRVERSTGLIGTVAGQLHAADQPSSGDGGPATEAILRDPTHLGLLPDGHIVVSDAPPGLRAFTPGGAIETYATTACGQYLAVSPDGVIVRCPPGLAPTGDDPAAPAALHRYTTGGDWVRIAGTSAVASPDGHPAVDAVLAHPIGTAVTSAGELLIADRDDHRLRQVGADGILRTLAGTGEAGSGGDGGPASAATLNHPVAVTVGTYGDIYVAENRRRVRVISPEGRISTHVAWEQHDIPTALAPHPQGGVYVSLLNRHAVYLARPDGSVTIVAGGNDASTLPNDGGPATAARVREPSGLAVDSRGNLFIATPDGVRRVGTDGTITTVLRAGARRIGIDSTDALHVVARYGYHVIHPDGSALTHALPRGDGLATPPVTVDGPVTSAGSGWVLAADTSLGRVFEVRVPRPGSTGLGWLTSTAVPGPTTEVEVAWAQPAAADTFVNVTMAPGTLPPPNVLSGWHIRSTQDAAHITSVIVGTRIVEPDGTVEPLTRGERYSFTASTVRPYGEHSFVYSRPRTVTVRAGDFDAPGPVRDLTATAALGSARLDWVNPDDVDLDGVLVRVAEGTTAPSRTTGTLVYRGAPRTSATVRDLRQGRDYTTAIYAYDQAGNHSSRSSRVLNGTRLSIQRSASRVTWPDRVTISGTLTRPRDGAALRNRDVAVQVRKVGTTKWSTLTTLRTSSTGTVSHQHRPRWNAEYRLAFRGAGNHLGSVSATTRVDMRPRITASLARSTIKVGETTKLSGSVEPAYPGQIVRLERRTSTGWTKVAETKLSSTSAYRFSISPSRKGTYEYRVTKPATADHVTGVSGRRKLTVS